MKPGEIFNPWKLFTGLFVPNALARFPGLSPGAKLLYGRLAQYAGKDGACYPSQETLAVEIGVTDRWVRKLIMELQDGGFIKAVRPKGTDRLNHKTSRYVFLWHIIFDRSGEEGSFRSEKEGSFRSYNKVLKENQKKENQNPSSEHAFRLAELLLSLILFRKPDFKKPNLQSWARDIDRMLRLDNRTPDRVEAVIRWTQQDPFWQVNILSAKTLRDKFDQLELKMNQPAKKSIGLQMQRPGDRCEDRSKYDAVPVEVLS